ncbi:splicing factor 3A subunit 1, putative [Plasmodium berghei]|uniref:Splicing factor 3A subunit 1, putative n=2 Tax=Plasmodium berghei TaxID=5821 RepID=A0A509API9_PLABA|nr:splicing factor 3A subunit 1, putative [Plasmodium berghei ANKA]CXI87626.1 splicing factor 3A subunit 1, putative [Plasmodium berghei]SCL95816.1 splicing factor 3A subunit 1, putative [Plasmodium berghei]SCM16292.1 splicing factor 3A subunit 1, putative [Plasmodium berghei]SCM18088.1 splicing factor 3A subunit 1, putative [Plasmodium berghei]SCN27514.1 splicing factor 3A subunit 1, putative [Plasmodium berghei]|eukprot:XP_034423170.1 splicing factor 3A subunit 1, putative [Plasmodium berghei ANKA]
MAKVIVKGSIFDDNVDVTDLELVNKRLEFLENEMIIPPNSIKSVIDKTAAFVKKNGKVFEQKIYKEKEKQFNFINSTHPYFFYYQYKLHEQFLGIQEKNTIPKAILEIKKREDLNKSSNNEHILKICDFVKEDIKKEKNKIIYSIDDQTKDEDTQEQQIEIKEDIYTIISPLISSVDVDLMKTTALFVARNGNKFLNELIEREKNNSQYDFLRANNLYYNFFSKLIDIYVKCLLPNNDIIDKIKKYSNNKRDVLNYSYSIYNHNMKKREEEERKLEEKTKCDTFYDWTNFTVVENITFDDNIEALPQSIDFNNVENYVLNQLFDTDKKYTNIEKINNISYHTSNINKEIHENGEIGEGQAHGDDSMDKYERKNEYSDDAIEIRKLEENPVDMSQEENNVSDNKYIKGRKQKSRLHGKLNKNDSEISYGEETLDNIQEIVDDDNEEKIIVVKNYEKSRKHKINKENVHLCPITNQPIDINDMTRHLKTLLLDPQWKEQKDKLYEKAKKEASFSPLEDIEGNLSLFVINRPDIFGSIDEEINEHTSNENKKTTKNAKKNEDVYSYIHNIYNKILPGPSIAHYPQNESTQSKEANTKNNKKQKTN